MPGHYHPKTLAKMDARLLKLKDFLVKAVSTEMQDHANEYKQDQQAVHRLLLEAYERTKANVKPELRDKVIDSAQADLIGYSPLESLLPDPEIIEIMVNGPKQIFIQRVGYCSRRMWNSKMRNTCSESLTGSWWGRFGMVKLWICSRR